jgi:hypothetical protein
MLMGEYLMRHPGGLPSVSFVTIIGGGKRFVKPTPRKGDSGSRSRKAKIIVAPRQNSTKNRLIFSDIYGNVMV